MVAVDGVVGMGGPPTDTATIALTRVTLMARPMAATTATAMLDLTGAATAGVVVGVVGDAIDGIPRGVAITKCFAKKAPAAVPGLATITGSPESCTSHQIGKAWRDRGDKMAAKLKWAGVAVTPQRE